MLFAHHGAPVAEPESGGGAAAFYILPVYDWRAEEAVLGRALMDWFPAITTVNAPEPRPEFIHQVCGLLNLADWVGSDRRAFPFEGAFRRDYWFDAQKRADARLAEIGLSGDLPLRGPAAWPLISDHPAPRPAQAAT